MSRVIVTHGAEMSRWADQFRRAAAWTRGAGIPPASEARGVEVIRSANRAGIVAGVIRAASRAGTGGEVLCSIGHGNAASVGANAMLGLDGDFTVTQEILRADATGRYSFGDSGGATGSVTLSAVDQTINTDFRSVGSALVAARVRRFTFLVCVLGRNLAFLNAVRAAWGNHIEVAGYAAFVGSETIAMSGDRSYPRTSQFLSNDAAGQSIIRGTDSEPATFLELPPDSFLTVAR